MSMQSTVESRRRAGRPAEREALVRERLPDALGWLGIGLGLTAATAPRQLARLIGVSDRGAALTVLRLVGLRELASGLGILTGRRPAFWLSARVAGDVMDLALLSAALTSRKARPSRVAATATAVVGVAMLDLLCRGKLGGGNGRAVTARKAITINRAAEPLYRCWRDFTNLPRFMRYLEAVQVTGDRRSRWKAATPAGVTIEWDAEIVDDRPNELVAWRTLEDAPVPHSGAVRFQSAPGARGTEVIVEMVYAPPAGAMAATMARLFGQAPEQLVQEDLRRFKQLMETGEILQSAGWKGGQR